MSYKKRVIDVEEWDEWYKELTHGLEPYDHYDMGYGDAVDRIDDWMDTQPIVDVDSGLVGQYRWERDVVIAQLEELGIGFGQKIEGVYVTNGHWEKYWDEENMSYSYRCSECKKDALTKDGTMHDQVCSSHCPYCGVKMTT